MKEDDDDYLAPEDQWSNTGEEIELRDFHGIPILKNEKRNDLITYYANRFDMNLLVWNDKTESHIWWDLVFPLSQKIARNRRIVLADVDTDLAPDPESIYPIIAIDCSTVTFSILKYLVRDQGPLSKLLKSENQDFFLYFHAVHKTKEKIGGIISCILERQLGCHSTKKHVVISGLYGDSNNWKNALLPNCIYKMRNFFLEEKTKM